MKVTQLCPNSLGPHGLCSPWNSPGQNTGVGSLSLLQGSFQPGDQTQVSLIAGGFFNSWATREAHKTYKWHKWLGQKLFFKYFKGTLGCSIAPFLYAKVKKAFGGNWTELQRHKARNQAVKSKGTKHIERHGFFSTGNLDLRPWPEVELDSLGSKSNVFVRGSFWSISWASSTWGTGSKGAGGRQNTQMGSARKSRRRPSVSGKLASVKSVLAFNKRLTGRPDSHGSVFTITCAQNILTTGQARTDGSSPLSDGEPDLQRQSHVQVWSWAGPSDRVDSSSGRSSHCGACPRPGKPPDSKSCTRFFQAWKPPGLTLSSDVGTHRSLLQLLLLVAKRTNSGSRFIPTVFSSYAWEDGVKI